ncbi:MAG TPA: hypothetical protein PL048_18210 [Leptospiraceae bacterium]|nr:hypothetical protein [Leptospiraceae bacterium]HNM04818.1 hypothetical protein [Leptospiraceae bacterium]HNO22070.1 hypothetical protein [Leptospiraceae bacterium]
MNFKTKLFCLAAGSVFFFSSSVSALGTYAEGWATAKILQFESRGIIFTSYEGSLELTSFNKEEKCDEAKDECFAPVKQKLDFSVRPENSEVVNFLNKHVNQEVLIQYNIHRITAIALSSQFEVLKAQKQETSAPANADKLVIKPTGSKRNFSVSGKIVQLDYQGTLIGTYEGLYLDETRGKIHPFSITSEDMAKYAWNCMKANEKYNMGISVAFVTGLRKSNYDLFEINYKAPAGGVVPPVN